MLIAMAEIGLNIGKRRQCIVLNISKVLAERGDMSGINRKNTGGTSENVFAAVSEIRKGGGRTTIGIGGGVINLPGNIVLIQQLEYCLCRELRRVVVKAGIEHITLRRSSGHRGQAVGNCLARHRREPAI